MKKVIFYFLVLLFAVWLGIVMHRNPGYVLISYHNFSIETSLWFAVIAIITLFMVLYTLFKLGSEVGSVSSSFMRWISNRRKQQARNQTISGLYELAEGRYASAEKKLSRAANYSDMPLINYLAASFACRRQDALKRSDNYLRLAQTVSGDRPVTMGLAQARSQMSNNQLEESGVTLQRIHRIQPRNILILQLLKQVYLDLKDWDRLEKLLPKLRKMKALEIDDLGCLEQTVYSNMLLSGVKTNSVIDIWNYLPRHMHKNSELVKIYTEYLLANNQSKEAENILKAILRKELSKDLLMLYADLQSLEPIKHLMRAEKWLKEEPENAELLLCLGKICRQQKLWGRARDYLEKSAKLEPCIQVYAELAHVMKDQDDLKGALEFYRKGAEL